MQQTQQREPGDRISWARAMIFAVGFFFLGALLVGQLPTYIFNQLTNPPLTTFEQGALALGAVCFAAFVIIQVYVLLFDPKPIVPPFIVGGLGALLTVAGLAVVLLAAVTGNQYWPAAGVQWNPVLGGNVLWLEPDAVDLIMLGIVIMIVGSAMALFGFLAIQEQRNPDRRDPGTTPVIRALIAIGSSMLFIFLMLYTFVSDTQLAAHLYPQCPVAIDPARGCPGPITGLFIARTIYNAFLGIAIFCTLGAFMLRLHYLMRPVRKRTMSVLYIIGINLAQFGVLFILLWFLAYPLLTWMHSWSFIGLGDYLTLCAKKSAIPQSCGLTAQGGYIVDTIVTTAFFVLLMAAIAAWKTRRNLVVICSVTITAVLSLATLLLHTNVDEVLIGALLCGGGLVLAGVWTSVARREFAVVGEKNLGCGGQWLVLGTCLLIYVAAFAFFSLPVFPNETEPNIPFTPGAGLVGAGGSINAVVVVIIIGLLAGLQFYLLTRNRYKL